MTNQLKEIYDDVRIPIILRKKYGEELYSIKRCLDILEEMVKNNKNVLKNRNFHSVDGRVQDAIFKAETSGIDVSEHRRRYDEIMKMVG